jgi:hypothetical protein
VNPERRRWEWEIASRRPRSAEHAAERVRRGVQLCRAALAGEPLSDPETPEQPAAGEALRVEYVACAGCYKPILAAPGSRCPDCGPSDLETPNA